MDSVHTLILKDLAPTEDSFVYGLQYLSMQSTKYSEFVSVTRSEPTRVN